MVDVISDILVTFRWSWSKVSGELLCSGVTVGKRMEVWIRLREKHIVLGMEEDSNASCQEWQSY